MNREDRASSELSCIIVNNSSDSVDHTIAICTANRRDIACQTLSSLLQILKYPKRTELIVVNNGREEDTEYIARHLNSYGVSKVACKVYYEPIPGLSYARNRVLDVACGEIISFLDDDSSPESHSWQEAVLTVFKENRDVALCGGPSWLVPPRGYPTQPWWRSGTTDVYFSCLYVYPQGVCPPSLIAGLNASYRRSAIGEVRFPERLGWSNRGRFAGEDSLFNELICGGKWKAWFENKAIVLHRIEPERYNTRWLLRRAYVGGKTGAVFSAIHGERRYTVGQRAVKHAIKSTIKGLLELLKFKLAGFFSELCNVTSNLGNLSMGTMSDDSLVNQNINE